MAAAMTAQAQPRTGARWWDEAAYRRRILRERDLSYRTLFRAVFFDHHDDPNPDVLFAAASSDVSLAPAYIEDSPFEKSLASELLHHTPPASTQLTITEGKEKQNLQAARSSTSSTQKRLFDVATASDQNIDIQNTNPTEEHTSHDIIDDKINPAAEKKRKIARSTRGSSTD